MYESEWSASRPDRFTPGKDPVPIVQKAEWASRPVSTGAENLAPTGIRSPVHPVGSRFTDWAVGYKHETEKHIKFL